MEHEKTFMTSGPGQALCTNIKSFARVGRRDPSLGKDASRSCHVSETECMTGRMGGAHSTGKQST